MKSSTVDISLFLWPASWFVGGPDGWWVGLFCMGAWLCVREIPGVGRDWISSWACGRKEKGEPKKRPLKIGRWTAVSFLRKGQDVLEEDAVYSCLPGFGVFWCVLVSLAILKRRRQMGSPCTGAPTTPSVQRKNTHDGCLFSWKLILRRVHIIINK